MSNNELCFVSETWNFLNDNTKDSYINVAGHTTLRCDRTKENSCRKLGCDGCAYFRSELPIEKLIFPGSKKLGDVVDFAFPICPCLLRFIILSSSC